MAPMREPSLSDWVGKKSWIPCSLQALSTRDFIKTVNSILRGHQRVEPYDRESGFGKTLLSENDWAS